jgi:hypothetical protein
MIEWNTCCVDEDTVYAVLFPATTVAEMQAKAYWQHTREVVSSHRAERALYHLRIPLTTCDTTQHQQKTEQAQTQQQQAPHVYHLAFLDTDLENSDYCCS